MGLKSILGNALGYTLLGFACISGLFAVYWAGMSVLTGATPGRIMFVLFGLGSMMTSGFFGYFVRKSVAGQVLPSGFDRSIAYRGGQ
ncbi:lipoprotein [Haloferax elongans ATCC BAA-1513]|uniref:Lipoprotein n=1 Tax=Haloferax elongans ATCC BAA-1513 TaxID=1230453 RepID=M0HD86_HALEO|nr:hypothetical protein [Haloferax elongans]ELZ82465.1 lipoprotein [Haloferax elongans ATCC BAA-1513]